MAAEASKQDKEQIRHYMAMKDCEKGIILYITGPGKTQQFEIVLTEEERRK